MEAQGQTLTKVIRMFKHYGCSEETLLTKQRLSEILNKQAAINLHSKFSPIIIDEIWGQTETTSRGESTVLTFSKIFSQAMAILEDRISIIDGPTGIMQK
jgi:acyl-coenzyme A synthetase/AMP-(fatty) acid ligase